MHIIEREEIINAIRKYYKQSKLQDSIHPMTNKEWNSYDAYKNFACEFLIEKIMERPTVDVADIVFEFITDMNYYIALAVTNGCGAYCYCFYVGRSVGDYIYHQILKEE